MAKPLHEKQKQQLSISFQAVPFHHSVLSGNFCSNAARFFAPLFYTAYIPISFPCYYNGFFSEKK
ncbi:hypothetical protein B4168_0688 [Anoxybacillus flavithermus]|nr:hypothetical protein B4168_0688 [Anoxybacillus flavithermus]